jgi:AAA15 family ATPase/GTPase
LFKKIILDNFKSFRHIEFDLTGSNGNPLKYAFIYGENGSGKSNLIESFMFLKNTLHTMDAGRMVNSIKQDIKGNPTLSAPKTRLKKDSKAAPAESVAVALNDLSEEILKMLLAKSEGGVEALVNSVRTVGSENDVSLDYTFTIEGHEGAYKMVFGTDNRPVYEKLTYLVEERVQTIFEISGHADVDASEGNNPIKTHFSPQLFKNKDYKREMEDLIRQYWGKHTMLSIVRDQIRQNNPQFMKDVLGTHIADVVKFFDGFSISCNDLGQDYGVGVNDTIMANLDQGRIPINRNSELMIYEKALDDFFTRIYSDIRRVYYHTTQRGTNIDYGLFFTKIIGGKERDIDVNTESAGTFKLLSLFPAFFECAQGKTVFFDEMDSGIHDKLMYDIISELKDSFSGQFIATTHNTSLLKVIEPQNIFVIQVDCFGEKKIMRIDSIKRTQKNNNNRNRYLNGEFEAIPIIGCIDFPDIVDHVKNSLRVKK